MFTPSLPDPRQFAHETPKNSLVLAFRAWQDSPSADKPAAEHHVRFLVEQALASGDDKLVGIALSLMPSAASYRTFWSLIADATWKHPQARLYPFVLPVVIVAGSPQPLTIPGLLADVARLRDIWSAAGVFAADSELWLSNHLISAAALHDIRPTQAFAWSLTDAPVHEGWPQLPGPAPLKDVRDEGAWLRFVPGLLRSAAVPAWPRGASGWGREVSTWMSGLLGATGATTLALPRAPQPLLAALEDGRQAQQDIAGQLYLGNALRQFREQGRQPTAVIAVHDNHELRVCLDDGDLQLVWSRALEALDDLAAIEQELCLFLQECRVEAVHVVKDVQPDQVGGRRHVCGLDAIAV